jgi:hypothetical protein
LQDHFQPERHAVHNTGLTSRDTAAGTLCWKNMRVKDDDIETNYLISMVITAYRKGKIPMNIAGERVVVRMYQSVRHYRLERGGTPIKSGKSNEIHMIEIGIAEKCHFIGIIRK